MVSPKWVRRAATDESDYELYTQFDMNQGEAQWVRKDDVLERYFTTFRIDEPLPEDNSFHLTLDEYLYVLEGEVTVTFQPDGPTETFGVGDRGFLPAGSTFRVKFTKLPFKEIFVMTPPE